MLDVSWLMAQHSWLLAHGQDRGARSRAWTGAGRMCTYVEVGIVVLASFELWLVHKCRCVVGDVCSTNEITMQMRVHHQIDPLFQKFVNKQKWPQINIDMMAKCK